MAHQRKRMPGERNREVDGTEVFLVQNTAHASAGTRRGIEIVRPAFAAWGWWQGRRRKKKAIAAYRASKGER